MAARQGYSGERATNFATACNLLSQYIKENGFAPNKGRLANSHIPKTMSLFPGVDVLDEHNERETDVKGSANELELFPQHPAMSEEITRTSDIREEERSQLTIIYDGKVMVFDHFSTKKADALIDFASNSSPNELNLSYVPPATTNTSVHGTKMVPVTMKSALAAKDLPLSRKASLQRFLEKRKDRIIAKAPYCLSGSPKKATPVKSEENASWLGLVPQVSKCTFSQSSDSSK